jgi:hypothetical protein
MRCAPALLDSKTGRLQGESEFHAKCAPEMSLKAKMISPISHASENKSALKNRQTIRASWSERQGTIRKGFSGTLDPPFATFH